MKPWWAKLAGACLVGLMLMQVVACGAASRATVHEQDMKKVFPWPSRQSEVMVRVRPQTSMANMCVWFGSFEEVKVTADTTFYLSDEVGKDFAFTPSRSPARRLAALKTMEIRWPPAKKAEPAPEKPAPQEEEESGAS